MKPRKRKLSNLWHRYGKARGLEAEEVAEALEGAGLIERIGPDQYRETEQKPRLKLEVFERIAAEALDRVPNQKRGPL